MSYLDKAKSVRCQMAAKPKEVQVTKETNDTNEASQTLQTVPTTTRNNPTFSGVEVEKQRDTMPRLPWELEALLRAAGSNVLPETVMLSSGLVTDFNRYVLACGCSFTYCIGDREEIVRRLWQAHRAWRGVS